MGFPTWLILLAAFNQELTGIPWVAGFTMASVFAGVAIAFADRRAVGKGTAARLGWKGRLVVTWLVVYAVLVVVVSAYGHRNGYPSGPTGPLSVLAIPFIVATIVTAFAEFTRRARGRN